MKGCRAGISSRRSMTACGGCKPIILISISRTASIRRRRWRRRCAHSTTWCGRARSAISVARIIPPGSSRWRSASARRTTGPASIACSRATTCCYREIEAELLPLCRDQGIGVIAYNPLAGGFLDRQISIARSTAAGADALHPWQNRRALPRTLLAAGPARSGARIARNSSSRAANRWCRSPSPGCWPNRESPRRSSVRASRSSSTPAWRP